MRNALQTIDIDGRAVVQLHHAKYLNVVLGPTAGRYVGGDGLGHIDVELNVGGGRGDVGDVAEDAETVVAAGESSGGGGTVNVV